MLFFYGPLKTYFNQETTKWLKNHPGRAVTQFQVSGLINVAYGKAATAGIAINGFRQTGIVPFNPDIFPDHLYAPADVTDQPEASVAVPEVQSSPVEAHLIEVDPSLYVMLCDVVFVFSCCVFEYDRINNTNNT